MKRRQILRGTGALVALAPWAARSATTAAGIQRFKGRSCGCCGVRVGHLRKARFGITAGDVHGAAVFASRRG
jgi:hypothetical protein